jgi:hypothetical protein
MSILSPITGYAGFKVIDDATQIEILNWEWVDDQELEYEVLDYPARFPFHGRAKCADFQGQRRHCEPLRARDTRQHAAADHAVNHAGQDSV